MSDQVDENQLLASAYQVDQPQIKNWIDQLTDAYYNSVPLVSDETFDRLINIYEERFGKYEEIGAPVRGATVELPVKLPSLSKMTTPEQVEKWSIKYPGPYILEDKMDGITLLYETKMIAGQPQIRLYTRGDGVEGKDVTHILPYINLPKMNGDILIRGELLYTKQDFEEIGEGHKDPRTLVGGTIGAKDSFDPNRARRLKFFAYQIIGEPYSNIFPEDQILALMDSGFLVPWAGKFDQITYDELVEINKIRKAEADYEIDGIVVSQNQPIIYRTSDGKPKNPDNSRAFKMETPIFQTVVTAVKWEASKNKLLKPVVVYEPVDIGTAILTNASGYNADFIVKNNINVGAVITVTRSGDVIPKIISVVQPADEPAYPDPDIHGDYDWGASHVDLVLKEDNQQVKSAKLKAFIDKLDIDNFGPTRIKKIVDHGIDSIYELLTATPQDFEQVDGIGKKLAQQIYSDLQQKINNVSLSKIMAGSGIFPNIGERRFNSIIIKIPNLLDLVNLPEQQAIETIQQVPGFKKLANEIVNKLPFFVVWLQDHPMINIKSEQPRTRIFEQDEIREFEQPEGSLLEYVGTELEIPQNLVGEIIVFSGIRDKQLEQQIQDRGGEVKSAVSRKTTKVLMKDTSDIKGKAKKALEYNIPLIQIDEFKQKYI